MSHRHVFININNNDKIMNVYLLWNVYKKHRLIIKLLIWKILDLVNIFMIFNIFRISHIILIYDNVYSLYGFSYVRIWEW